MVCSWNEKDYGIDAIVEITNTISESHTHVVSGKRFSLQLKSSSSIAFNDGSCSHTVEKTKIIYWYGSIEPVLVVYVDVKTEKCYYLWIDEMLIEDLYNRNKNWISQETITLRFKDAQWLDRAAMNKLENYVLHWKRPAKTILTPGKYFQYNSDLRNSIQQLSVISDQYGVDVLAGQIKDTKKQIGRTIYTIAIVGPSRVGKSTLINCLLQREISPVGVLPTTGIPITIYPRSVDKSEILFKDKTKKEGPVDHTFLKQYTSQEHNKKNYKNVELVSVSIVNQLLEKGLALCDVPGLDDPDENIRNITKTALASVGAIVYVIDAGIMKSGSFSLTQTIIHELHTLGRQMERVFIVFSKMDQLTPRREKILKEYVEETLTEYDITPYLPCPPIYISSKQSYKARKGDETAVDSVKLLEDAIWKFLLEQNKTGMNKLLADYESSLDLLNKLMHVIKSRLIDANRRGEIENDIAQVSRDITQVRKIVPDHIISINNNTKNYIDSSFENLLRYLQTDLETVPLANELPNKSTITKWLQDNANTVLAGVYNNLDLQLADLSRKINLWIGQQLKQVESDLERAYKRSQASLPDIEFYSHYVGSNFDDERARHPGFLETILIGLMNGISSIVTIIEDVFYSPETKRKARIGHIVRSGKRGYNEIASHLLLCVNVYLNHASQTIVENSVERANVYLHSMDTELKKLSTPLTSDQRANFKSCLRDMQSIHDLLVSKLNNLKDYSEGISRSSTL